MIGKTLLLSMALAAQAPSTSGSTPAREDPAWIEIGPATIAARVQSNGCTTKDDFRVAVLRSDGPTRLEFWREKPDRCRAYIRDGVVLSWTRSELGLHAAESIAVRRTAP